VTQIDPPAGSEIELPGTIRLVISTGPPYADVPELYGMTVEDARTVLQMEGFRLGTVDRDPFSAQPAGRVIGQWPAGGDQARSGAVVNVTVAGPENGNL
jgi:eukaryotic-like serine/threonine-protein kinase